MEPCGELVVLGVSPRVVALELREEVEVRPLHLGADAGWRPEIEDRRALRPERRALIERREKAVRPVRGAALRKVDLGKNDESGQVLIRRAESIRHPRADRRVAAEAVARVHVVARRRVVDRLSDATAVVAKIVGDRSQAREEPVHRQPALAGSLELEGALDEVALAGRHRARELVLAMELLHVELVELRLGIERVDVARSALEEEEDARLRATRDVTGLRSERPRFLRAQERVKRDGSERRAEPEEELASIESRRLPGRCVLRDTHDLDLSRRRRTRSN